MARKMNQLLAWLLAFVISGAIFTVVIAVMINSGDHDPDMVSSGGQEASHEEHTSRHEEPAEGAKAHGDHEAHSDHEDHGDHEAHGSKEEHVNHPEKPSEAHGAEGEEEIKADSFKHEKAPH